MGVLDSNGASASVPGPKMAAPFSQRKASSSATGANSFRREWNCRPEAGQNSTPARRRREIRGNRASGGSFFP